MLYGLSFSTISVKEKPLYGLFRHLANFILLSK